MTRIGVLALQGAFEAHARALTACGADAREVRIPAELGGLDGLVIPGGESTVLIQLIREYGFDFALPRFAASGRALFGTCAGAIVLARGVSAPSQWSLGLLDIDIERNAYGRQIDSFEGKVRAIDPSLTPTKPETAAEGALPAVFIRAPRIRRVGSRVAVLASRGDEPVLVREGLVLASTYHPELTRDLRVHRYFLDRVVPRREAGREPASIMTLP